MLEGANPRDLEATFSHTQPSVESGYILCPENLVEIELKKKKKKKWFIWQKKFQEKENLGCDVHTSH